MSTVATSGHAAEIDRFVPEWRWNERHSIEIAAPPARVEEALRRLRPDELPLASVLMGLRRLPARLAGRGPPQKRSRPLLDAFVAGGFVPLADLSDGELVLGLVARPWQLLEGARRVDGADGYLSFAEPGFVKVATNFRLERHGEVTRVETETRIQPTDARAARAFGLYWLVVYPGSALIRREWLRAVRRKAEASATMPV